MGCGGLMCGCGDGKVPFEANMKQNNIKMHRKALSLNWWKTQTSHACVTNENALFM